MRKTAGAVKQTGGICAIVEMARQCAGSYARWLHAFLKSATFTQMAAQE